MYLVKWCKIQAFWITVGSMPTCSPMRCYCTVKIQYLYNGLWLQSQHMIDIRTSVLYVNGKPSIVTMDYMIDTASCNDKKLSAIDEKNDEESVRYFSHCITLALQFFQYDSF